MDIVREREVKRALHYICDKDLVNIVAPLSGIFLSRLFYMYGLKFDAKTIKQKRLLVQRAIEYFVLERLLGSVISKEDTPYGWVTSDSAWDTLSDYIIELETLAHKYSEPEEFIKEFSQIHNVEEKSFTQIVAVNIKDLTSFFDNTLENLYNSEK